MRHSPLALWHLLSLDAPTVATLWTWFIARCCGVILPSTSLVSMFLTVWMLYASDRLLDARALGSAPRPENLQGQLEARHHFHQQHRRAFLTAILLCAPLLATFLPRLLPDALRLYALLGCLLFAWFLLIHTRLAADIRLPKEIAVGLFFPAAVFIPTVARRPDLRLALLLPALLFAAACSLNCLFVYAWEHPSDRSHAHWTTKIATRHLTTFSILQLVLSFVCTAAYPRFLFGTVALPHNAALLPAAITISVVLLMLLHHCRASVSAVHVRAAADLALLTPLLITPILFLRR